ncbi:MAG: DUF4382 domain-containing protein [Candidatus Pacearchaeota archaeon]
MNKKGIGIIGIIVIAVLVIGAYFLLFKGGNTGTLVMQITDAPPQDINIEKALLTISAIEVHMAAATGAAETNESEANATETKAGWIEVVKGPVTYDLIAIKDVKELLGEKKLEAGKYTQVRLKINKAVVTIDGVEYDLEVPSESLKLVKGFTITAGQTTTLTLDFDAQESIMQAGKGDYKLQPVVKIIQE